MMVLEDGYYRPAPGTFKIRKSYFADHKWHEEVIVFEDTRYIVAAMEASRIAKELDAEYGDSHFWTVDLKNAKDESYFQLFHGRTE